MKDHASPERVAYVTLSGVTIVHPSLTVLPRSPSTVSKLDSGHTNEVVSVIHITSLSERKM
jgi:hypothetical protein